MPHCRLVTCHLSSVTQCHMPTCDNASLPPASAARGQARRKPLWFRSGCDTVHAGHTAADAGNIPVTCARAAGLQKGTAEGDCRHSETAAGSLQSGRPTPRHHHRRRPRPTQWSRPYVYPAARRCVSLCWRPLKGIRPQAGGSPPFMVHAMYPLCDIPSGCCFFTGPWDSHPLFPCCVGSLLSVGRCGRCSCWCRSRSPVVGVPGLCWMWQDVPFARQPPPPPPL